MVASNVIVVLGASGDLAKKKTFPALFGVFKHDYMPENTKIFGYARSDMSREEFHKRISEKLGDDKEKVQKFLDLCHYVKGSYDKDEDFKKLTKEMEDFEKDSKDKRRIFYLALPPSVYGQVGKGLKHNCYTDNGKVRLIVEKPFGMDTESSLELGKQLSSLWKEDEIYRIDHYLGKEMVKNILPLRFANVFFSAAWNRTFIDNVQITFKEPFGTEGRGGYFDEFGIIRDVIQNHLIQVLCYIAMEKPISLDAEHVRDEKVKVLRAIKPLTADQVLIGQYVKSEDGSKPGYKDDSGVDKDSNAPTFAATSLHIDNERWSGVPFIIKSGKALDEHKVEVRIQFREVPGNIFPDVSRNELVIRLQPNESVYVKYQNKLPGLEMKTVISELDLTYKERFPNQRIPDAYEALILDVLNDNHSNFVRNDELDAAWRIFTPILHEIDAKKIVSKPYAYGTRGPKELSEFIEKNGYKRNSQKYDWKEVKTQQGKL
ncbi:glucose-6-phosphate 1-dehydrogenase [Neoconidiobolus thromboides FSU 785]|nr:glucose-6-phosphate 1-dehydrogenase [Neoconidiobolus thromboides FSU 785]